MDSVKELKYPRLAALLNNGTIFIRHNSYVGVAKDGTEISIGEVGFERDAEIYLRANPTRETW